MKEEPSYMMFARAKIKAQEGPYLDFAARGAYLRNEADTAARLCAQRLLEGRADEAKYWAEEYGAHKAKSAALWAFYDVRKDDPHKWVGYYNHT